MVFNLIIRIKTNNEYYNYNLLLLIVIIYSRMFQISEEFFTSLGLKAMPVEFWHNSILEKPTNRPISCKASAWDFCNKYDYR
jgi:hypothetical protein